MPAYQTLADDIRAQITSGRLRPGDRLPTEPQLCLRSGLGRSTVREALRLLASEHLIVTTRGVTGGSFVAHPNPEKVADTLTTGVRLLLTTAAVSGADLMEVREMLEVPAARLAAQRRTPEEIETLRATLFDPRCDDTETMLTAHRAFHLALAASTNNPLYGVITRPLYSMVTDRQIADVAGAHYWERIDAEHRAILRSIADGDPAGAATAVTTHLAHLREVFSKLKKVNPPAVAAVPPRRG